MSINSPVWESFTQLYRMIEENEENLEFLYRLEEDVVGTDEDILSGEELDEIPDDLVRETEDGYRLTEAVEVYFDNRIESRHVFANILKERGYLEPRATDN